MVVVVLVGGQIVVPKIATSVMRSRLTKGGTVLSAQLSAFPWFKLIGQDADSLSASVTSYDVKPSQLESLLHEAEGIGKLDISFRTVNTGLLTLHNVSFTKRGDQMAGVATVDIRDLQRALPIVQSLTPVHTSSGQLVLRGTASVLGVSASVEVVVAAQDGKLVVAPSGLFGALATVTLYNDPQIRVQSVTATEVPGGLEFVTRGRVV